MFREQAEQAGMRWQEGGGVATPMSEYDVAETMPRQWNAVTEMHSPAPTDTLRDVRMHADT